ncbi:DUF2187 domain-containing protein [Aerococcaceae bacterium DSM 109653]|uniref:DUF2187 domain-containing protein n=1 Tax=Fundicoccus ignavus TaxID=2664442 RepID=A0A6I2GCH6_9LACT|nr:DUF2187 domain-containing protein [Fundicoccus ignavus]MRI80702.1 DUF2187 domain-containing protein [Fundicoccus ignavus]MRI84936.1 DUF2187 domain-containing protein [Fundicoccus ignavus]
MAAKLSKDQRALIEKELRRGTSKSRIATLLNVDYDEGLEMIEKVKASIRPDIGDKITFTFRAMDMTGIIVKLLTNSAVVEIYWDKSDKTLHDIIEERTIVNFKDIIDFVTLPPQDEDEGLILDSQPIVSDIDEAQE